MYIKRNIEEKILKASRNYPVLMVCGQRQVGKSTMLNHLREEDRKYVTLDDFNALRLAQEDPPLFFETYGNKLLIDEFQRAPHLLLEIKRIVDEQSLDEKDNSGMFWLTGSQKFEMMQGVSDSLAGRIAIFELTGFSQSELNGLQNGCTDWNPEVLKERLEKCKVKNIHQLYSSIFSGSLPKLLTSQIDHDRYYMDYVNTYLERDVKTLAQVGKLTDFHNFLIFMASRTAQELKYEEISNSIGISAPTAKQWVSILERSGIIYILHPYFSNLTKRLVKTPKVYFMDTGLASYLCKWTSSETLENGAMDGAILETFVVTEIIKAYYNLGKEPPLYYYRDIDKKEIDLLIVEDNQITPIEIKKNMNPKDADKNFYVLDKFGMTIKKGIILCMSNEVLPYNRQTWYCPISVL